MGLPQGLTKNLEDLQQALEGLTEETAQTREDNVAARTQNEVLQAAVNALQFQMVSMGQVGQAINAMQMQQPNQAQMQSQQIPGRHQNSNIGGPYSPPPKSMAGTTSGTNTAMVGTSAKTPSMSTIPTAGRLSASKQPTFSAKGTRQGTRQHSGPNAMVNYQTGGYQAGGQHMQRPQQQQQQQGGYQQPQQVQYRNQRPLPTNFSYCCSHGYAVSAQHNIMLFMNCAPGHQTN